jgi:glyceraldehyde-3-phosphate dehydrogenase/erythrose-4-phosphate dehydrogenase
MKTQLIESDDAVVMSPLDRPADATVIWLHGLGADGHAVIGGNLVRVVSWYDNEWGFSNRMADTAVAMGRFL